MKDHKQGQTDDQRSGDAGTQVDQGTLQPAGGDGAGVVVDIKKTVLGVRFAGAGQCHAVAAFPFENRIGEGAEQAFLQGSGEIGKGLVVRMGDPRHVDSILGEQAIDDLLGEITVDAEHGLGGCVANQ